MEADQRTAGVPFPPPLAYLFGLLAGIGLEIAFPTDDLSTALRVAVAIAGIGAAIYFAAGAARRFSKAGTPAIPFEPTEALVTSGPYRQTRNPMYVGMACLYIGLSFAFGTLWPLAALPFVLIAIDRLVIAREEPYLERLFGAEYLEYKQRVRRWL